MLFRSGELRQLLILVPGRTDLPRREIQSRLRLNGYCGGLQRSDLRRFLRGSCGSKLSLSGSEICHVQDLFCASISLAWIATITGCRRSMYAQRAELTLATLTRLSSFH